MWYNDQTAEEQKEVWGNSHAAEEQKGLSGSYKESQVRVVHFVVYEQSDYGQALARLTCSDQGEDN